LTIAGRCGLTEDVVMDIEDLFLEGFSPMEILEELE